LKSFAILRTNVGLTTNIKIVVDSNYALYLNSIESRDELSNSKFKKIKFTEENYYDELISYFYKELPSDIAYHIKYDNDIDTMSNNYSDQYDDIYNYGARNIIENKYYDEKFEYFAPLYIFTNNLPSNFIIFRVDGSGIEDINKQNFNLKIINNLKTIKVFDLTNESSLGKWLDFNFKLNDFFPLTPFEMSFENLDFSRWNGIDYEFGGYISRSMFLESFYEKEKEIYEFEKYIFDGYKNNKIVFPNILNLSFLFNDNNENLKWTINRYFGFYIDDMIKVNTVSPYITPSIKSDVIINKGNILYSDSGDPFVNGFSDNKKNYIEYNGDYYNVEKYLEIKSNKVLQKVEVDGVISDMYVNETSVNYKIISDVDLVGKQLFINKNYALIGDQTSNQNRLLNYDNTNYQINDWETADVWLIEIDGIFHNIVKETGEELINNSLIETTRFVINSDYYFKISKNYYEYWTNDDDVKRVNLIDDDNYPVKFNIYKLKFTDIKDFDNRIIDTDYSRFEYEKKYEITETDETKIYFKNLYSNSIPKNYDDFIFKDSVVNIPVSSEYTANYETFKIENNTLSEIWRKNEVYCRWGFQNSISSYDLPYLLNNSLIFEDYNRTVNPFDPIPSRIERNLDYFYTINPSTHSYVFHSLHVINDDNVFELGKYLNLATPSTNNYIYDYFTEFFEKKTLFDNNNINKNSKKYSYFNKGNESIPNITLFRGIKFIIYDVEDIKKDENGIINVINLKTSNKFDDYKFSILLTNEPNWQILQSESDKNIGLLTEYENSMNWTIFDEWKMDKQYYTGDVVIKDDILYIANNDNTITNPIKEYDNAKKSISAPYNQIEWSLYNDLGSNSIFWNPSITYELGNYVYNNEDYYYYSGGVDDFWNPIISDNNGYSINDVVLFKGKYYISMTSSNHYRPDFKEYYDVSYVYNERRSSLYGDDVYDVVGDYYWQETKSLNPKWNVVELWKQNNLYNINYFIVYNNILYKSLSKTNDEPGLSNSWMRIYSLVPDDTIYNLSTNPIIEMNNSYYKINTNNSNSTLKNGINIYINNKWKNILINIYISDNTLLNLSDSDRDLIYNELNEKLTAYNFIQCINNISNKYGFSDYLNYIIVDENNIIHEYNYNSIEGLPYYIVCETPTDINIKNDSISYKYLETTRELKSRKILSSINNDLSNLNYYNNVPISYEINENINYNPTNDVIYRFTGMYMPVFYTIDLFKSCYLNSDNKFIESNYKFDTSLTNFGIIKERKIRKCNHNGSVLKLYNIKDNVSIYPMLDEFGYTTSDLFIFKSPWDYKYNYITSNDLYSSYNTIEVNDNTIGSKSKIKNTKL